MFKRFAFQISVLIFICLLGVFGLVHESIQTKAGVETTPTVIIDAGHGGFDGGAVASDGTAEKDINLEISLKLAEMLRLNGFKVIMTRTEDTGTDTVSGSIAKRKKNDLQNRLKLMEENPDALYISVHLNKFTTSAANGTQVFYTPNFKEAYNLSLCVQKSVVSMLQPENTRTVKQASRSSSFLTVRTSLQTRTRSRTIRWAQA